jgi:hypothetical protein
MGVHTTNMQNFITIGSVVYEHIEDKQTNTHGIIDIGYVYVYVYVYYIY